MKLLFIFLDGVGLGKDDPQVNPLVQAAMPNMEKLLDGHKLISNGDLSGLVHKTSAYHTDRVTLLPLDACLSVDGVPQSASGQATLLTGENVSRMMGFHDGPKPNPWIMDFLRKGTLFSWMSEDKRQVSLLNAFPPRYFDSIETGYRMQGVIAMAASFAGLPLKTAGDLNRGEAISADFTAQGWLDHLHIPETPVLSPFQAGERLACLADGSELSFFEYWLTDVVGHHQDMGDACTLLELFDAVLGSLVNGWDDEEGLILITSDHGNLEDLSSRHHTRNDVPLLLIGSGQLRHNFIDRLDQARGSRDHYDLTDITPAILNLA